LLLSGFTDTAIYIAHFWHIFGHADFMAHLELTDEIIPSLSPRQQLEEFYDRNFAAGGSFGLRVGAGGKRSYFLIYSLHGHRRRMTLGAYPTLSLSEARSKAQGLLRMVAQGRDPARELRLYRRS